MVTDAMSKEELQKFLVSKTKLATSEKPVVAVDAGEKPAPRRGGRKKNTQ